MIATVQRDRWTGLTIIVAAYYLALGIAVGGETGVTAILGAVLIGCGLALRSRCRVIAAILLIVGSFSLAALTWWSAITPILAVLVLIFGGLAIATVRRTPILGTNS